MSSKRVVGVVAPAALVGLYVAHVAVTLAVAWRLGTPPSAPDATLGGIVAALALGSLGLSSIDKHSPQAKTDAVIAEQRATGAVRAIPDQES